MDALIAMKAIPLLRSKWSWWNNTSRSKSSSAEAAALNGWTKQATKKLKGKNFLRKMQWQRAAQADKHLLLEASEVTVVQTTLTYLKVCQDRVTRNSGPDLLYPCLPLCSFKKKAENSNDLPEVEGTSCGVCPQKDTQLSHFFQGWWTLSDEISECARFKQWAEPLGEDGGWRRFGGPSTVASLNES